MDGSRLLEHIGRLDVKQRERFRLFVQSPYFNQHQKTMDLLDLILDHLEGGKVALERVKVFNKLFPGEKFEEQPLFNVMSYLKKLYHRFLAHEKFGQQEQEEELLTLEAAYESNQFDLLKNRSKHFEKKMAKYPYRDSQYLLINYRYYNLLGYYGSHYEDRSKEEVLQRMLDYLDRYYLLEKLKHACHLTANMINVNTRFDFSFLDAVLQYYNENRSKYSDDRGVGLYYTILMSLREPDRPEHYASLKHLLDHELESFTLNQQRDLYISANNYCIRRINLGDNSFQRELFERYKQGLATSLILDNGLLTELNYRNITSLGCLLKDYDWTEQFIEEFQHRLPSHRRENAYNYNLAHLYHSRKKYNDALSILLLVQFSDVKYHLSANTLLLRTYYDVGDTEALLSLVDTFRIYVIRNRKMTIEQKRSYTNFLRFAKKLALLKHQASTYSRHTYQEKLTALADKIAKTANIANRSWLEEECTLPAAVGR